MQTKIFFSEGNSKSSTLKIVPTEFFKFEFDDDLIQWPVEGLRIFSVQWNMGGMSGPHKIEELSFISTIQKKLIFLEADIVMFATQECSNPIINSFCCNSMLAWRRLIFDFMSFSHSLIIDDRLNALGTMIFAKHSIKSSIKG